MPVEYKRVLAEQEAAALAEQDVAVAQ